MKPELKAKWLAALRGGEFEQLSPGGADWTRNGKHCCIGVLGELLGKQQEMADHVLVGAFGSDVDLPLQKMNELIDMNDGKNGKVRHTFSQIANWIEANL